MKCDEVKTLLWDLYEGGLPPETRREVIAHISSCADCAREAAISEEVNRALRVRPLMKAPERATAGVMQRVRAEARRRRVYAALRRQWWPITAAAAALVFVALGLWGVIPGFETSSAAPNRFDALVSSAGERIGAIADSAVDSAWRTFDLGAVTPYLSGWFWLGAVALAAVLALVAAEKYVCDRHLALKVQSRLQRR